VRYKNVETRSLDDVTSGCPVSEMEEQFIINAILKWRMGIEYPERTVSVCSPSHLVQL
jgi:hypothetical protein